MVPDFAFHVPLCEFLIRELHTRGLAAHLGRDKPTALLEEQYHQPHLKRNAAHFV